MPDAPSDDPAWNKYADYLLSTYVSSDSKFPPELWTSTAENERRPNNAAEAFHSQYNAQFYAAHPNIYVFINVINKLQANTNLKKWFWDERVPVLRREKDKMTKIQGLYKKYLCQWRNWQSEFRDGNKLHDLKHPAHPSTSPERPKMS